jgi:hypothetical protein
MDSTKLRADLEQVRNTAVDLYEWHSRFCSDIEGHIPRTGAQLEFKRLWDRLGLAIEAALRRA